MTDMLDFTIDQHTHSGGTKFWDIYRVGKFVWRHYGKIGTAGQVKCDDYSSDTDAERAKSKIINKKLVRNAKGVYESTGTWSRRLRADIDNGMEELAEPQLTTLERPVPTVVGEYLVKVATGDGESVIAKGPKKEALPPEDLAETYADESWGMFS